MWRHAITTLDLGLPAKTSKTAFIATNFIARVSDM